MNIIIHNHFAYCRSGSYFSYDHSNNLYDKNIYLLHNYSEFELFYNKLINSYLCDF